MQLSACIEWQFGEAGPDLADRLRAAHAAGFSLCEFHLWRDKNIAGIAAAMADTGVALTGICVDPRRSIVDPAEHEEMLTAVAETLAVAARLGRPPLIVASGFKVEGMSEAEHFANAVAVLKRAAALAEEAGVMLVLEPLNTELFATMYLVHTPLALDLIEAVGSPNLRLLYDVYHSAVMGEDLRTVLAGRAQLVAHVQVAGCPGRNEPGTGALDYADVMQALAELGYTGPIGLEYFPTMDSVASTHMAREVMGG